MGRSSWRPPCHRETVRSCHQLRRTGGSCEADGSPFALTEMVSGASGREACNRNDQEKANRRSHHEHRDQQDHQRQEQDGQEGP